MTIESLECYCSSGRPFSDCCEPYLLGVTKPDTAEQLMRSRFSAFCLGNGEYLMETHHPDFLGSLTAEKLSQGADEWQWTQLDVLEHLNLSTDKARVAFNAWYLEEDTLMCHHEVSEFVRLEGEWKYTQGKFETRPASATKLGRNDLCPCGSGKKYKKCHQ